MTNFSNILVSPAPFKGVLTAAEAADAIKEGLLLAQPGANVKVLPMADGGMGTVSTVMGALGGEIREIDVSGPMGSIVQAKYAIIEGGEVAVIEMAAAAGFIHITRETCDPMKASTRGVGMLIADAMDHGCKKIIIGLGDSATVDLGLGMISELGAVFLDDQGVEVVPVPENFPKISQIEMSKVSPMLKEIEFFGYADVRNPVLVSEDSHSSGLEGAIRIYGPQKGVTPETLPVLEEGVEHIIEIMEAKFDVKLFDEPMTGAAGGLGAGVRAFLNGSLVHGAPAIAKLIGLGDHIKEADLIVTGEGKLDHQSMSGKVVSEIASIAMNNGKPCWVVVGKVEDKSAVEKAGFNKIIEVSPEKIPSSEEAKELIKNAMVTL